MKAKNNRQLDLCCFSYVAPAQILRIEQYPRAGYGAEVLEIVKTIAADGPMVLLAASRLGLNVGLIGNQVGADTASRELVDVLTNENVSTTVSTSSNTTTAPLTLILDDLYGSRTWFSYLPTVGDDLLRADLSMLSRSSLAYIDLYAIIREASIRAVEYASRSKVPIFINLGGSPLTRELANTLRNKGIVVVQTNIDKFSEEKPKQLAGEILQLIEPEVVLITLGEQGAVYLSSQESVHVPAYKVDATHTHGAGAAFSAGYAFAYLNNWTAADSLRFACALGAMSCTGVDGFRRFSRQDVLEFIQEHRYRTT